ncbi:MAG: hypothetical protein ONB32_16080 [candidate division KSB1 bacterium]|nr:hypothetical protein [candidate division KSB1 bacterium]
MSSIGKMILPLLDHLNKTTILKNLEFLNQSQWWSTDQLQQLQEEKLHRVMKAAYQGVPYYRNLFNQHGLTDKDIRSIEDLKKLPILDKATFRRNWQQFINQNCQAKKAIKSFTSGSTGTPLQFLLSREQESWRWAARYRFWQWAGYELGTSYANMSVHPRNSLIKRFQDIITNCTYFHIHQADQAQFDDFLNKIISKKIDFLVGYAHSVYLLAKFAQQQRIQEIRLKGIVTHGETLFPHFRNLIEHQFGCRVSDLYGAGGEGFHIAAQCEYGNGYHIDMENVIVETKELGSGAAEIILTGLDNEVMPLIRYHIGDLGKISHEKCKCGRGLIVLEEVSGRTGDLVVTPNHQFLSALFFNWLFERAQGIEQFQVIQKNVAAISIRFVPNSNFKSDELEAIGDEIIQASNYQLNVSFEKVDNVPVSPSGKRRWVISEVWSALNANTTAAI